MQDPLTALIEALLYLQVQSVHWQPGIWMPSALRIFVLAAWNMYNWGHECFYPQQQIIIPAAMNLLQMQSIFNNSLLYSIIIILFIKLSARKMACSDTSIPCRPLVVIFYWQPGNNRYGFIIQLVMQMSHCCIVLLVWYKTCAKSRESVYRCMWLIPAATNLT